MSKTPFLIATGLAALLLTGCVGLSIGGGTKAETQKPTIGQQLVDLQNARTSGAITDAEFQVQKEKLLREN